MSKKRTVCFKANSEILVRLDAVAEIVRRPGREPIRSDAILAAIHVGLSAIEADPSVLQKAASRIGTKRSTPRG